MSKLNSTSTAVMTSVVLAASVGFAVQYLSERRDVKHPAVAASGDTNAISTGAIAAQPAKPVWAASAPGRVEPRKGETRIGAQAAGRVVEVLVAANDRVSAGDPLVRIDDEDAHAKLAAAEAEAAVRKRERDAETVGKLAQDRRSAEDAVAAADRQLYQARRDLDRAVAARHAGNGNDEELAKARAAIPAAREKADQERQALRKTQATSGMPLPTRLESALTTARAEILQIEAAIERARVRAPVDGTVLQLGTKLGEIVTPSPEQPLAVVGDLSAVRVRAEVEERDVAKIRNGQKAVIRNDAYPGRDFTGTVTMVSQALAPPRLPSRGPRRPTDVETLEVLLDVEGQTPLLPGMRTDVFFLPDPASTAAAPVKTN